MKKKLIIATAIVLVLAICTTLLVGCDEIFKKNEKRDALQVVATVTYNGQTDNVYKFELATTFNNYAYMYVNYYGMSYEAAANYLAQSLAQPKTAHALCQGEGCRIERTFRRARKHCGSPF